MKFHQMPPLRRLMEWARSEVAVLREMPRLPRSHNVDTVPLSGPRAPLRAQPADADWTARAKRGEPAAVDWLVREHWQRVEGLLVRTLGPRQDLEDLVQTTFLETLRVLPSFRGDSSLATFICGIAVRVGLRARQPNKMTRASVPVEHPDELASTQPSAEHEYEQAEALRRVQAVLDRISEPKRVAFVLWAVEGMHVDDVASAMQASVAATRSRIFYAQKALRAASARDPYLSRWLIPGGKHERG